MSHPLRMGIIGVRMGGAYGARIHKSEHAEFVAMCARSEASLQKRLTLYQDENGASPACYTDPQAMLQKENLDAVVISTPSSTHHELANLCAKHGVHVLIDKPADISVANIESMETEMNKHGVTSGVIYPSRLNPLFAGLKRVIDKNTLGKPLVGNLRLNFLRDQAYYDNGGWRGTWQYDGGGSLMNQGAHPMDLLCWWFGQPVSVIGEFGALHHDIETEDWTAGVITFANGFRCTISTTTCAAPKNDSVEFDYYAENGSIRLNKNTVTHSCLEENLETLERPVFEHPVEEFIDAVLNGREPLVPLEQGKWSVQIIEGLYASGRSGKRVDFTSSAAVV